jgi:hypothetical protein
MENKTYILTEEKKSLIIDFLRNRFYAKALTVLNSLDEIPKYLESLELKELEEIADRCRIEIDVKKLKEEEKK